tara:strand:- start:65 stop:988 length:924 start_codon:yes stop_codon:yes gene_type:complete
MNFYGKNAEQDKYFVEIRNRLELIYWVASDLDHFVENNPEKINKDVLATIFLNYIRLKNFYNQTKEKIHSLKGIHKECASVLADYTEICIDEFDFIQNENRREESEDIKFSRLLDADLNFRDKFDKYFLKTDVEFHRINAYKHFTLALSSGLDFLAFINNSSDLVLAENKRLDTLRHFGDAQSALRVGCRLMEVNNASIKDFVIAYSGKTAISTQQYHQLQVEFNTVLEELFFVQRDFYSQFEKDQFPADSEVKLADYETAKYYGQMHKIGFEISKMILDEMHIEIPNFVLLSPSTYINQFDFIKVK